MEKIHNVKASKFFVMLYWAVFVLFAFFLIYKLYLTTVVEYKEYARNAAKLQWKLMTYDSDRGLIYDSNKIVLVSNDYNYTVVCTPREIVSSALKQDMTRDELKNDICELLELEEDKVEEILPPVTKDKNGEYIVDNKDKRADVDGIDLKRNVEASVKESFEEYVNDKKLHGFSYVSLPQRKYNYDNLASHILGYAANDGESLKGLYGLEAYYNSELSGRNGYRYSEVDQFSGGVLPYSKATQSDAIDGNNIVLNIDMNIQRIVEEECRNAYETYSPKKGVKAVMMNPNTGAIYAMVSLPDYNLNEPYGIPYGMDETKWDGFSDEEQIQYLLSDVWRNGCISDTYEPGSTFKSLTTAMAFEENLANENDYFSDAPIKVSSTHTISCWLQKSRGGNHGTETLTSAFAQSCNPVFVQLAQKLGVNKYYDYVHTLGFYEKTGVDLPAEGTGIFHEHPTKVDMSCLAFGESATVTPIQLLNSYCALINGGNLMQPHLVKYITDQDDNIVDEIEPTVVRNVFSSNTCARIRSLMEKVVEAGSGTSGKVIGYSVAGKTSTATFEEGEDKGMHVLSFSSYAPSYDPKIALLVVVDRPEDKSLGSSVTAAISSRIIDRVLSYMNVPRKFTNEEFKTLSQSSKYVLDVKGLSVSEANSKLTSTGVSTIYGTPDLKTDNKVGFTYPDNSTAIYTMGAGVVVLYPEGVTEEQRLMTEVPDLSGKSAVECLNVLKRNNLNIKFNGEINGSCRTQSVEAGTKVQAGSIINVTLSS